jgi:argininosuccinate synthase
MFQLSTSPQLAPDRETEITLDFDKSAPVALNGKKVKPVELMAALNKLGGENGIGRADVVESRTVGMKARGVYETPAGTILYQALRELEMLCLDADTLRQKALLAVQYADLVYRGKWFTILRESIDAFMENACRYVSGKVRLVLYKGNIIVAGRESPYSLYNEDLASFGATGYDHGDATGFIKLFGLPVEAGALARKKKRK